MPESDKKEIKGYMKELSDDFERQIGVYVEHVDDKFKVTSEGMDTINQKLDRVEKTLDSHTEILNNHSNVLQHLSQEVALIKDKAEDHSERISVLEKV